MWNNEKYNWNQFKKHKTMDKFEPQHIHYPNLEQIGK